METQVKEEGRIYCEKLSCSLSVETCRRRQDIAKRYGRERIGGFKKHEECLECEQGKALGGPMSKDKQQKVCKFEGCEGIVLARGMCRMHYDDWYLKNVKSKGVKAKAVPKKSKGIKEEKKAPSSITQFVDGLMATVRREVIAEMREAVNDCFDRMSK